MLKHPVQEQAEVAAVIAPTVADSAPRLLVIDDDIVHRMVICRAAAKVGYMTIEASSCDEAERLLRQCVYDCISLDLSLGRRGGVEVLHFIASLGCKTPIVIISGTDAGIRGEAMDIARRLTLKAYEPLSKPVDLDQLRRTFALIKLRTDAGL
jgi:two-component system, chemotaxis family, chemotaxis protein CheY